MTPEQAKVHDAAHSAFAAEAGSRVVGGEELASMLPQVRASHSGVEIRPVVAHG
jgi:hypothetical protein